MVKTHLVARVQVHHPELGLLWQSYQIAGGRVRERNFPNLSETVEPGESFLEAAVRGLLEELGLTVNPERLDFLGKSEEIKPSPSSGEVKRYLFADFSLLISREESFPLEVDEGDVVTVFEWRRR